jgi:hypothetical protein
MLIKKRLLETAISFFIPVYRNTINPKIPVQLKYFC